MAPDVGVRLWAEDVHSVGPRSIYLSITAFCYFFSFMTSQVTGDASPLERIKNKSLNRFTEVCLLACRSTGRANGGREGTGHRSTYLKSSKCVRCGMKS